MNFVTDHPDDNVFHFFLDEVLALKGADLDQLGQARLFILRGGIDEASPPQRWRKWILGGVFSEVRYTTRCRARWLHRAERLRRKAAYDPHRFITFDPDPQVIALVDRIRQNLEISPQHEPHVLLVQRPQGDRQLLDAETRLPLQEVLEPALEKRGIPFRTCDFTTLSPREQIEICSGARLFIAAHGAGITNFAFTPKGSQLFEYNFRNHWYCDPLCDRHQGGELAFDVDCGGPLTFRSEFHKADYHNLAGLLGRGYTELPVEGYEGVLDENPIRRRRLLVDGRGLVERIERAEIDFTPQG